MSYENWTREELIEALDETKKQLEEILEKANEAFISISKRLDWDNFVGKQRIPKKILKEFPELDNDVSKAAWFAREAANDCLNYVDSPEYFESHSSPDFSEKIQAFKQLAEEKKEAIA